MLKPSSHKIKPQQVRIIGGQWKRTPLPVADLEGLRPSPDRVRETVFNWLTHLLHDNWQHATCLDLFAGSGALGFEAASRGAKQVCMVELQAAAFRNLQQIQQKLGASQVRLARGDALRALQEYSRAGQQFDLIFLDPPFQQGWLDRLLPLCTSLLTANGLLYVETEYDLREHVERLQQWEIVRADKAGQVHFHLLQCRMAPENQA